MDEWYSVWSVENGRIELVAKFKYPDAAAEHLRTEISSGYVSHQGRIIDKKNVVGL